MRPPSAAELAGALTSLDALPDKNAQRSLLALTERPCGHLTQRRRRRPSATRNSRVVAAS
jgi:hypothetical protein